MELLGIGPLELLVIVLIAVLIFSPKDLAKGGREIGRWINRLYRSETWKSMRQVSQEMQNLPNRLAREAQLDELKELEKDINLDSGSPYTRPNPANSIPPDKQTRGGDEESPSITEPDKIETPDKADDEKK
jgi:Sec-independent protein translocase protein TatA